MSQEKGQPLVNVENVFERAEHYIEDNKKSLLIIIGAVVVMVGAFFAWKLLYMKPLEAEAKAAMFQAEDYFAKDSFNLAINGKGEAIGFSEVADEYGNTKAGNLAHYYLGVSYFRTGKYQEAIDNLKEFDGDDEMVGPIATGLIGDSYAQLNNVDEALNYYEKAAEQTTNRFTTPYFLKKAAVIHEEKNNYAEAIKLYERIKTEFFESAEARDIDKYLARARAKNSK